MRAKTNKAVSFEETSSGFREMIGELNDWGYSLDMESIREFNEKYKFKVKGYECEYWKATTNPSSIGKMLAQTLTMQELLRKVE